LGGLHLHCVGISRVCMPNPNISAFIVSEIAAFIRKDGHGWIDLDSILVMNICPSLPSIAFVLYILSLSSQLPKM